ncbi:polyprenyl diphosphate synthase [Patescibacteria group bacterium]
MAKKNHLPIHVAVIPDGNRRWAKPRKLEPWDGHEAGAENTENIIKKAFNLGIQQLSFWGSSMDNLKKRPMAENRALLKIYKKYFTRLINSKEVHEKKARINIIGKWEEQFPNSLQKVINECIDKTKDYKNYFLNFFLAYNGDDEMVDAVKNIASKHKTAKNITAKTIKENLMTKDLAPVDFLIRTGGEPHLSVGFMMWDIANAQLFFSEKLFPDFDAKEFEKAIKEYEKRGRRLGK